MAPAEKGAKVVAVPEFGRRAKMEFEGGVSVAVFVEGLLIRSFKGETLSTAQLVRPEVRRSEFLLSNGRQLLLLNNSSLRNNNNNNNSSHRNNNNNNSNSNSSPSSNSNSNSSNNNNSNNNGTHKNNNNSSFNKCSTP